MRGRTFPPTGRIGLLAAAGVVASLTLAGCTTLAENQRTPRMGGGAPELEGTDQHHQQVSLGALAAKGPVLVVFYRGHW